MVIIKDMEMPKCCSECPLFHFFIDINGILHYICKCGNVEMLGDFENERNDFCPLIEMKEESENKE